MATPTPAVFTFNLEPRLIAEAADFLALFHNRGRLARRGGSRSDAAVLTCLTAGGYKSWAVIEWECTYKDSVQGATEGPAFVAQHLIDIPTRAFDDFAGAGATPRRTEGYWGSGKGCRRPMSRPWRCRMRRSSSFFLEAVILRWSSYLDRLEGRPNQRSHGSRVRSHWIESRNFRSISDRRAASVIPATCHRALSSLH